MQKSYRTGGLVSIVSHSRPSLMKHESGSSRFQPGEGPSRGLLRDYEPSDGPFWSTSPHWSVVTITRSPGIMGNMEPLTFYNTHPFTAHCTIVHQETGDIDTNSGECKGWFIHCVIRERWGSANSQWDHIKYDGLRYVICGNADGSRILIMQMFCSDFILVGEVY